MSNSLIIKKIQRVTTIGTVEEIVLNDGITLITGKPNIGKSTWLKHIDFLLGKNKTLKEIFTDTELAEKYIEISGEFLINGQLVTIARKPFESGNTTKVFLNGEALTTEQFSLEINKLLGFPTNIKFPKGNPYTSQWIELTFRIVFRHIYRGENAWGDIADNQPKNEQFAAQYQILGIAEIIYSHAFDNAIVDEKELARLEMQRAEYKNILAKIAEEMAPKDTEEPLLNANENNIEIRIQDLELQLRNLEKERNEIVEQNLEKIELNDNVQRVKNTDIVSEKAKLVSESQYLSTSVYEIKEKIKQYTFLGAEIDKELIRLKRTKLAESISDIKVSHCPACDQTIKKRDVGLNECFLCGQEKSSQNDKNRYDRVDFEMRQLESERKEVEEIISTLNRNVSTLEYQNKAISERIDYLNRQLQPLKSAIFSYTDDTISKIDVGRGIIQEKIASYRRLQSNINMKESLNLEIHNLEEKINTTKRQYEEKTSTIDFHTIADDLADGMQYYVDRVANLNSEAWKNNGRISIAINETRIAFYVNNKSWDSLGGLDKDVFLLAYQFGLLSLTGKKNYRFPGLVLIDLPAQLAEAKADSYNYIVQPFLEYFRSYTGTTPIQVIIAGRSFGKLENVVNIDLDILNYE